MAGDGQAGVEVSFPGVDTEAFPADFGLFHRYHRALEDITWQRWWPTRALSTADIDRFLAAAGDRYPARWLRDDAAEWRSHMVPTMH